MELRPRVSILRTFDRRMNQKALRKYLDGAAISQNLNMKKPSNKRFFRVFLFNGRRFPSRNSISLPSRFVFVARRNYDFSKLLETMFARTFLKSSSPTHKKIPYTSPSKCLKIFSNSKERLLRNLFFWIEIFITTRLCVLRTNWIYFHRIQWKLKLKKNKAQRLVLRKK